jgi:hypothetical protein
MSTNNCGVIIDTYKVILPTLGNIKATCPTKLDCLNSTSLADIDMNLTLESFFFTKAQYWLSILISPIVGFELRDAGIPILSLAIECTDFGAQDIGELI